MLHCLKQNTIEKWIKDCILLFSKKGDPKITKNYRGKTLIAVKVYNALLLNHIKPETEKVNRKNPNDLGGN